MTTIAQKRLEQAAEQGLVVLSPDTSRAIHHYPADEQIELSPDLGVEDTLVGKAAARLAELLRPLTAEDRVHAGVAPRYRHDDTYHIPNAPIAEKPAEK